ncbi:hypothetical protein BDV40DRAFT_280904 [Aspergillus tamarii]|uniref:Uncharacterized protein n=1 Tax=Aspergillus tamarii TaxID=41984 RepID=A0A5N6UE76_ASPTM|nr:hypothetical protein BDV40DRAFT_280904 [Aspergillus tamarii]
MAATRFLHLPLVNCSLLTALIIWQNYLLRRRWISSTGLLQCQIYMDLNSFHTFISLPDQYKPV